MGTRFMASQECPVHPGIKELLLKTREMDTMVIERSIKNAARVIRTDFSEKVLEMETRGATLEELLPWLDGLDVLSRKMLQAALKIRFNDKPLAAAFELIKQVES